jgi:hypothetical protein
LHPLARGSNPARGQSFLRGARHGRTIPLSEIDNHSHLTHDPGGG